MIDSFGRKVDYLRLSVTDRCDLRCRYCMPVKMNFSNKKDSLSYKDLIKISDALIRIGIKKIRLTGGEPLVRKDILKVLEFLDLCKKNGKVNEITMTTNGTMLNKLSYLLVKNGIKRLNISIDSLIAEKYNFITNGGELKKVLSGVELAKRLGIKIKINMVLIKNFNEDEIIPITKWCALKGFKLSFIEIMPIGKTEIPRKNQYFPVYKAQDLITKEFGLQKSSFTSNGPSKYFETTKYNSIIGFISPISNKFCSSCNRIRVTSNGILYGCLGNEKSLDIKPLLNEKKSIFINELKKSIFNKPEKHFFQINNKVPAVERFMNLTGG